MLSGHVSLGKILRSTDVVLEVKIRVMIHFDKAQSHVEMHFLVHYLDEISGGESRIGT